MSRYGILFSLIFASLELFLGLPVNASEFYHHNCLPWSVDGMSQTRTFGGCYTKSTVALTWTEARDVCSSNGGYLFKPTDLFEGNLFMYEYDCVFIGLFWNSTNGWKWLDGSSLDFEAWENYVRPASKSPFSCAAMCQGPDPGDADMRSAWWIEQSCDSKLEFVCESDPVPIRPARSKRRPQRPAQKSRSMGFRLESYGRLTAEPDMETRAFSSTMCAGECLKRLNPCLALNYNDAKKSCLGFSSLESMDMQTGGRRDWVILVEFVLGAY